MDDILSYIPQRPPFVMIGTLLAAGDQYCRTSYTVKEDNLFVDNSRWSEAGLLENMAQTVAAGAGYRALNNHTPVEVGFIAAVKSFEVFHLPSVGDELVTEGFITDSVFNMIRVRGTIRHEDKLICSCEMNIFVGPQS